MKRVSFVLGLLLACWAGGVMGCVSRAQARAEAAAAYAAGLREGMARTGPVVQGPTVIFSGQVRTPYVPWTPKLTLAQAILAAGYYAPTDPVRITITRHGTEIPVEVEQLLAGNDVPLEAGDLIKIE
ncbi:MAG TPA: hypothetical protein PKX23_07170 [Verrucomicrobiota bacterium]|nr:hypothetical protein [Verrucomicrobiota bacterium]HRT55956.1 hypothetical protein [Candidatus Paceibacterota bacterium]